GDRGGPVARRAGRADDGNAEVVVGPAAGFRGLLDPVAVLAVDRAPADARPRRLARLRPVRTAAGPGAPGPGLAVGDDRGRRGGLLHPLRLREPHAAGARQRAAHPGRGGRARPQAGRRRRDTTRTTCRTCATPPMWWRSWRAGC